MLTNFLVVYFPFCRKSERQHSDRLKRELDAAIVRQRINKNLSVRAAKEADKLDGVLRSVLSMRGDRLENGKATTRNSG